MPVPAARILRAIRLAAPHAAIRVVGTNALYAYEVLAGVKFDASSTATGDIDLLVDDRNRLKILTESEEEMGLIGLIHREVDKSFQPRSPRDFRLTNKDGYMVEFIRPEPRPIFRKMPGGTPLVAGDVEPAPIGGLQWLVNAPSVEVVAIDDGGFPVPMRTPDPRFWAAHKLWLAGRENRDPQKKNSRRPAGAPACRTYRHENAAVPLRKGVRPHIAALSAFCRRGGPEGRAKTAARQAQLVMLERLKSVRRNSCGRSPSATRLP